jgi:hypothetical protein
MYIRAKRLALQADRRRTNHLPRLREVGAIASALARRGGQIGAIALAVGAVALMAAPGPRIALAKDAQSKAALSCRSATARQALKASKTTLSAIAKCQASRLRGKIPASADCSDLSVADVKGEIPRDGNASEAALRASIDKKCGSSDPSRPLHHEGDIAGSVLAAVDHAVDYAHSAIGEPEPELSKLAQNCQKTVTRTGSKLLDTLLKATIKCQMRVDKDDAREGAFFPGPPDPSCPGPPEKSLEKARTSIDNACAAKGITGEDVGACADLPDCIIEAAQNQSSMVANMVYGSFPEEPLDLAEALLQLGYSIEEIVQALGKAYALTEPEALAVLREAGVDTFEIEIVALAEKFAPVLRFDDWNYGLSSTIHYPMSPQVFYDNVVAGPYNYMSNTSGDPVTAGDVPTYWNATECGSQIRITYWWFYGRQDTCDGTSGAHNGDWEHVMVILSEDRSQPYGVVYYQHEGRYLRLKHVHGFDLHDETHPVVYVGRQAHGSYHYKAYDQSCCYWADHRNGSGPALLSAENLIRLRTSDQGGELWMDADLEGGFTWGPGGIEGHPMQREVPCQERACVGQSGWGCHTSGCWQSDCRFGDTDCGLYCAEGGSLNCGLVWKLYDNDYVIPTSDSGIGP